MRLLRVSVRRVLVGRIPTTILEVEVLDPDPQCGLAHGLNSLALGMGLAFVDSRRLDGREPVVEVWTFEEIYLGLEAA